MANTGNTQQIINYGTAPNDGTGDPLRTAFIKTDENFSNIWDAGPVGSNISIVNNTIQNDATNANIIIKPNGTGVIQTNASILPNAANIRDLGTSSQRFRAAYIGSGGLDVSANISGNYILGNGAFLTGISGGSTYGNANVAAYLPTYDGELNPSDINAENITANNITVFDQAEIQQLQVLGQINTNNIANRFPIDVTTGAPGNTYTWQFAGNILRGPEGGTWQSAADTIYLSSPANGWINLESYQNGNVVSEIFMEHSFIRFLVDNGVPAKTWQMNLDGSFSVPGDIIPQSNGTASLGNATNYWSNLWVANNTIYIGGVPLGISAGNVLTVNGEAVLSNDSNSSITTTGNITADVFTGNVLGIGNITTSAANLNIVPPGNAGINITATGPGGVVQIQGGNNIVSLRQGTPEFEVRADEFNVGINAGTDGDVTLDIAQGGNGSAYIETTAGTWRFSNTGVLSFPGGTVSIVALEDMIEIFTDANLGRHNGIQIETNIDTEIFNQGNVTIIADRGGANYNWIFGNTGNLVLPDGGDIVFEGGDGVIGKNGDDLVISWDDEELVLRSVNGDVQLEADNDVEIRSGYNFGTGDYGSRWIFNNNGELQGIPQDTANSSSYDGGYIQFVGNSSGDGLGYTTLQLIPDETAVSGQQYLIIDPTGGGHIHIRAGGTQDNSDAQLFLGGENSYVSVGAGSNPPITVTANSNQWNFDVNGDLAAPGNISATGNVSGANLIATGNIVLTGSLVGSGASPAPTLSGFSSVSAQTLSATGNISGNTAGFAIGYRDIPQVSFTGNATIAITDAGKHYYSTESTDYILTIADNSAVTWPVGTAITVVNRGTGNITIAQAAGVSLYLAGNSSAGNRTVTTYGMATVLNVAANVWMINGTGVS
jgi:hypothetical protein